MSERDSDPSWELLPMEILEKIFGFLPKLLLRNVGLVCNQWGNTVHRCAVKHLTHCIETLQIEEKQLERFGWKTSAAWDHDSVTCACIHLASNFPSIRDFLKENLAKTLVNGDTW